jgi:hypothetical protein
MIKASSSAIRQGLDRLGLSLSALCIVHCLLTLLLVSGFGIGGQLFLAHFWHEIGLAAAMLVAAVAIGWGALRHRQPAPFVMAMMGLSFMGGALAVPHGPKELILTIIGVALVAAAHLINLRKGHLPSQPS